MDGTTHGLERDPALAAALRDAYGDPPEVDWEGLRGRITAQAELPLARMRRSGGGWRRPLRALVPLAAAAGIAGTAFTLMRPAENPRELTQADRQQVEQILDASTPALSDMVGTDELLNAALGS